MREIKTDRDRDRDLSPKLLKLSIFALSGKAKAFCVEQKVR